MPNTTRSLSTGLRLGLAVVACPLLADSVRIVDFGHDWGVGFYRDVIPTRYTDIDVDDDGLSSDDLARGWTFSLTTPLNPLENNYDSQLPSSRFYGGVYAAIANRAGSGTSAPSEGHINQNHELRDDWNLMALPSTSGQPQLESYEAAGLWLWKKEDFLNGASEVPVSFSAGDNISVFISRYWGGVNWGRWVVQNGSLFYVSEPTFAGLTEPVTKNSPAGTSSLVTKKAHAIDPTTVRWAPYDPATPPPRAMFFDWLASPDYQYRSFDDVQSVGFLVQRDLAVGEPAAQALTANEPIAVKWNAVKVTATIPAPTAGSPNIELVPVAGISSAPAIWASSTEISYRQWLSVFRWADSNQRPANFTDGIDRRTPPYSFERDGAIGSAEASLASVHQSDEPVTTITWYDAIVWCNALSELESREPAYYADAEFTVPFREVFPRNLTQARDQRLPVYWKVSAGGYRLPTESEWKALAADASTAGAWIGANSSGKTQSVATQSANSLGLYDMVGNVAEFIWDSPSATFDPATQTSHKVLGGSFRYPADENAASLIPFGEVPSQGTASVGFRPVRNGDGSLPPASGSFPERVIVNHAVIPAAAPMSDEALRIVVRDILPLTEVPQSGSLAPGSTNTNPQSTASNYDLEVGNVEIRYELWIRVKQWSERSLGYRFNYSGDMGSARFNPQLSRGPDEPVTQISWFDAVIWCNALSELMGLDPVYRKANGDIEREAPAFRLSAYEYYGYPNTGQYVSRPEVDTSMIYALLPDPTLNGYRLPTRYEARIYGNTAYSHTDALNKTTVDYGWFKNDPVFAGNPSLLKALPGGAKLPNINGIHDVLGNVQEWTYGGSSLFGQYHYGNDFGWASNTYPHTMNREEHVSVGRYFIGMRVVKLAGAGNMPPGFDADPLTVPDAPAGVAYSGTIGDRATDPNPGDVIAYAKVSGPAWLAIAADGSLSGTPALADGGANSFVVSATDTAGASSQVTLSINVITTTEAPVFSPATGNFEGSATIALSSPTPGVSGFRYTVDGSDPAGSTGIPTTGPITLHTVGTTTIRAIALHPTFSASAVSSAVFTITAGLPPSVSIAPSSQTVGEGWAFGFTSLAAGTPPLAYQWRLDGTPIPGANAATYSLSAATTQDAGTYTLVVTSPYGSTTSAGATLSVLPGLTSTAPVVAVEPAPLVHSALPDGVSAHTFTLQNTGLAELSYTVTLPAGSPVSSPPAEVDYLSWSYANAADGLGINQVANTGTSQASWGALSGAGTLSGKLRFRTAVTSETFAGGGTLGFSSGTRTLEVEIAAWNIPVGSTSQWFQLSFQDDTSSSVTAGLVMQTNANGLALWGRALGTGGTNLSGTGAWSETSSTEGIGTRTPIRQYGWSEAGPVTLRLVADFSGRTYDIYYRDSTTGGAFVKAASSGAIASTRNGNALRMRMSGDWSQANEYIDVSAIRVKGVGAPTAVVGDYSMTRSTQGGPAFVWREIASTANGGTRITALNNTDDSTTSLSFPGGFTFPFYGNTFSSAYVSSNGFLSFTNNTTSYSNVSLPSTAAIKNLIAYLWDDLKLDANSSVWYRLDVDGLVVTFNDLHRYGNTSLRFTAQVILFADGKIALQYRSIGASTAWSATVGIQNAAGNTGVLVSHNNSSTMPVAGETILFTPDNGSAEGPAWLTGATPGSGTLGTLATQDVQLGFDTSGLALGTYEASVLITSNDPATPAYTLPIILQVIDSLGPPVIDAITLPQATVGEAFTASFTHSGGVGDVAWTLDSGDLPPGLVLLPDGTLSGTPTNHGDFAFTVSITDANSQNTTRQFGLTVLPPPSPQIATTSLPDATVNTPYSVTLAASSGLAPYAWSISTGSLPAGLSLNGSSGSITGSPVPAGDFNITFRVTDDYGQSAERALALHVEAPPALAIETDTLPAAVVNLPYGYQLSASGGYGGETWSVAGALPEGFSLSANGVLSGTAATAGSHALTFTVTDQNGGEASRLLYLVVSTIAEGRPAVEAGGWNLHYVRYWDQSDYFNDVMLTSSEWEYNWDTYPFELDALGYPVNIPAGITPASKITLYEPGQYTLTWQGDGEVVLDGAVSLVSSDLTGPVKRRVYDKTSGERTPAIVRVMIQQQVPATDIHVWSPGTAPVGEEPAETFRPAFLERLKDHSAVLRFMDWEATNSSLTKPWAERIRPGRSTQDSPTAYEYMIELANAADKDMWICVPHLGDAAYAANLARLILTGMDGDQQVCQPLKPNLKVYVEWSNEVWNTDFPQTKWAIALAKERLGLQPTDALPDYNEVWRISGERHAETFKIFTDAFAGQPAGRLVKVLGAQIGGGNVDLNMEGVMRIADADPANKTDYLPDQLAVGAYFGSKFSTWVLANVDYASRSPAAYEAAFNRLRDYEVLQAFNGSIESSARAAARHGLALVAYEGGQHLAGVGNEQAVSALNTFLMSMNRDPRMGAMITLAMDVWERHGGGLFLAFNQVGPYGSYGSWGFREYWYQTLAEAPKAAAFDEWMRRMQQSHITSYELDDTILGDPIFDRLEHVSLADPVRYSLVSGALPAGIALQTDGTFAGVARDYGDFDFTVQLTDQAGKIDRRSYTVTVHPAASPQHLSAKADTYVASWQPTSNFGGATELYAGSSASRATYAKWDLSALAGKAIDQATLLVHRKTGSSGTGTIYRHDGTLWDEYNVTWNERLALGSAVTTFPIDGAATTHAVDLTTWVAEQRGNPDAGLTLISSVSTTWYSGESTAHEGFVLVVDARPQQLVPSTWENWLALHLDAASPSDRDPLADADGDGRLNLLEYALGSSPLAADSAAPSLQPSPDGALLFRFPFHAGLRDLRIRVLGSTDLVDWNLTLFDSSADASGYPAEWRDVEIDCAPLLPAGASRIFLRLVVDAVP